MAVDREAIKAQFLRNAFSLGYTKNSAAILVFAGKNDALQSRLARLTPILVPCIITILLGGIAQLG